MARHRDLTASTLPLAYAAGGEPRRPALPLIGEAHADVRGDRRRHRRHQRGAASRGRPEPRCASSRPRRIGACGTGRAFGQVVPYLRTEPARAQADLGFEAGERLIRAAADAPELGSSRGRTPSYRLRHGGRRPDLRRAFRGRRRDPARERRRAWAARGVDLPLLDAAGDGRRRDRRRPLPRGARSSHAALRSIRSPMRAAWRVPRVAAGARCMSKAAVTALARHSVRLACRDRDRERSFATR